MLTQMSFKEADGSISRVQKTHIRLSDNSIRSSKLGVCSLSHTFIRFQGLLQNNFRSFLAACNFTVFHFVLFIAFDFCLFFPSRFLHLHFFILFLVSSFCSYISFFCPSLSPLGFLCFSVSLIFSVSLVFLFNSNL